MNLPASPNTASRRYYVAAMSLLALLAACGGGSGDVKSITPPRTPTGALPQAGYITADAAGNVYAANYLNLIVVKVDANGTISLMGGQSNELGTQDGIGEGARFTSPSYLTVDKAGNLFVSEAGYTQPGTIDVNVPRAAVRKITPAGVVTTFAGSPGSGKASDVGSTNGIGTAARLNGPAGIAADPSGNVFVAESAGTIRKVTPEGVVTTFAGTAGQNGSVDGIGAAARFATPGQMAADAAGNLYLLESFMDGQKVTQRIRKITPAAVVSTFSADVPQGSAGVGLAVHPVNGSLYLSASGAIYKFDAAGVAIKTTMTFPEGRFGGMAFTGPNELTLLSAASLLKFRIDG